MSRSRRSPTWLTTVRGVAWILATPLMPLLAQGRPGTVATITFTEEQRYGGGDAAGDLVNPTTLAVDGAGRLYVADVKPLVVKVYATNGTLLRTIGREGGGPGEFRVAWIAARGPHLVVHDPRQSRTSVFDTSGRYLRSWTSFCCHQNEIFIDRANRIVVPAPAQMDDASQSIRRVLYVRYRMDGAVVDTVAIAMPGEERLWSVARRGADGKPSGSTSVKVPFTPTLVFAWHPEGGLVRAWSAQYRIVRSTTGRDSTDLVVRRDAPVSIPEPLRRAAVDTQVARLGGVVGEAEARQAIRLQDVPKTQPAFTRLFVDEEGSVWAARLSLDERTTTFDVFDHQGLPLGTAVLPVVLPEWGGVRFTHGLVYVRADDDDGRPVVIRYRINGRGRT